MAAKRSEDRQQVQVTHNVVIGEDSIVIAQTGFSGSVSVGREATIAGMSLWLTLLISGTEQYLEGSRVMQNPFIPERCYSVPQPCRIAFG